jgi:NAD+ diphosphatase
MDVNPLDRVAHRRTDDAWLAQRWADPRTRVLRAGDGTVALAGTADEPRLGLAAPDGVVGADRVLLGVDDATDVAYFALLSPPDVDDSADSGAPQIGGPNTLRRAAPRLPTGELAIALHALALANWHETHPHCARCGARTVVAEAGYLRRCPEDGSEHHPRTDPAVIMLVTDAADRALLGRHVRWPGAFFSTVAGFVEPGESAEDAVAREVAEETGLLVDPASVRYAGSQSWPFPSSLMLAFRAQVADAVDGAEAAEPHPDGVELAEARWFTRDDVVAGTNDGSLLLPPSSSIARRLIDAWLAESV